MTASTTKSIERVSVEDLMSLVSERASGRGAMAAPMQVGAVVLLDTTMPLDARPTLAELGERFRGIRRLSQRLVRVPLGCGRPVWVDDPHFDEARHLAEIVCPAPGGDAAVMRVAADLLMTPLPQDGPLWAARLVSGVGPDRAALVIVFHHVLADGVGALAILERLTDGAPPADPSGQSKNPMPGRLVLAGNALGERLRGLSDAAAGIRRVAAAVSGLRPTGRVRAKPSSLNRKTGPRRACAVARVELGTVVDVAHAHGVTVNDLLLTAIGAALGHLLAGRGEWVDEFIVSVPFSSRRQASVDELGNHSAVVPVCVPAAGEWTARLGAVARSTAEAKRAPRGATNAVLGPAFRILAHLGVYERFINRQRLIHTFVTNLRGPQRPAAMLGRPIIGIAPLGIATGNVTVSFAALSYAGELAVTMTADPDACPDLPALRDALEAELRLAGALHR